MESQSGVTEAVSQCAGERAAVKVQLSDENSAETQCEGVNQMSNDLHAESTIITYQQEPHSGKKYMAQQ